MKKNTAAIWVVLVLLWLIGPASAQPAWQWASTASNVTPTVDGSGVNASAVDAAGNITVAGYFRGRLTLGSFTIVSAGGRDLFVARLNPAGSWTQLVRAGGSGDDEAFALALDATGTAVIAGSFDSPALAFGTTALASAGLLDVFVARLSAAGTWTQAVRAGSPDNETAASLAIDGNGNVALAGRFFGASSTFGTTTLAGAGGSDLYVARLSAAGLWTQAVRAGGPGTDVAAGLTLNSAGVVTLCGGFSGNASFGALSLTSAGNLDVFAARLSSAGVWLQAARAGGADADYATALADDGNGNAVVVGQYGSTSADFGPVQITGPGRTSMFVAGLSPAGGWTQATPVSTSDAIRARAVALDAAGNAIVGGYFSGISVRLGATTLVNAGISDIYVARLDASGNWTQAVRAGGTSSDFADVLALDRAGNVIVAGAFLGAATFGASTISTAGTFTTAYVARLGGLALATRAAASAEAFTLAPNPATTAVRLAWPEAGSIPRTVQVLDALGREVRRQLLPARVAISMVDVAGLVPGVYVVRCGAAARLLRVE